MGENNSQNDGKLKLIIGPMYSGKTTELIRQIKRYQFLNISNITLKPNIDTRYNKGTVITTHDQTTHTATLCDTNNILQTNLEQYNVVAIDEGQFFTDLYEACKIWLEQGKTIIVAALQSKFDQTPFEQISLLYPIADEIRQLKSICYKCKKDAIFSERIDMENKSDVVIGGSEAYRAVCRSCFSSNIEVRRLPEITKPIDIQKLNMHYCPQCENCSQCENNSNERSFSKTNNFTRNWAILDCQCHVYQLIGLECQAHEKTENDRYIILCKQDPNIFIYHNDIDKIKQIISKLNQNFHLTFIIVDTHWQPTQRKYKAVYIDDCTQKGVQTFDNIETAKAWLAATDSLYNLIELIDDFPEHIFHSSEITDISPKYIVSSYSDVTIRMCFDDLYAARIWMMREHVFTGKYYYIENQTLIPSPSDIVININNIPIYINRFTNTLNAMLWLESNNSNLNNGLPSKISKSHTSKYLVISEQNPSSNHFPCISLSAAFELKSTMNKKSAYEKFHVIDYSQLQKSKTYTLYLVYNGNEIELMEFKSTIDVFNWLNDDNFIRSYCKKHSIVKNTLS